MRWFLACAWAALAVAGLACDSREPGSAQRPTPARVEPTSAAVAPPKPRLAEVWMGRARFVARNPQTMSASPLEVEAFTVDVEDLGGIAQTTIDLTVRSPSDEVMEAVIEVPLTSSAAVTAATLHVDGRVMPAIFVSRSKARRSYERIVGRGRDPLLVSWRGRSVEVNVFPVPAKGSRRLTLTWVEPVADGMIRVPVLGRDGKAFATASEVRVAGKRVEVADGAVSLSPGPNVLRATPAGGATHGYELVSGPAHPSNVVVVVETSAPGGGYGDASIQWQMAELRALLAKVDRGAVVSLLAADWLVEPIASRKSPDEAIASLGTIEERPRAGLLDLGLALTRAQQEAEAIDAATIVWIGPAASRVSYGGDAQWRERLAKAGLRLVHLPGERVDFSPAAGPAFTSARGVEQLGGLVFSSVASRPSGDGWLELASATGAPIWIRRVGDAEQGTGGALGTAAAALWRRALAARDPIGASPAPERSGTQIVDRQTSLLALESAAQYQRFGIELPKDGSAAGPAPEGKLALVERAVGGSGIGPGGSIGARARLQRPDLPVPGIRFERSRIVGPLKKGAARRDLKNARGVFRACFVRRLERGTIAGEVSLTLTVAGTGRVGDVDVGGLEDPGIRKCVDKYVASLRFEREKAPSTVSVSIVLQPSGASEWKEARRRLNKNAKYEIVEEPLAKLVPGQERSGLSLYWALWDDVVRRAGYFGAGCEIVPHLFDQAGHRSAARRVLSECAPSFPKQARNKLESWQLEDDVTRLGQLRDPYSMWLR